MVASMGTTISARLLPMLVCMLAVSPASAFLPAPVLGSHSAALTRPRLPPERPILSMCGGTAHGLLHTAAAIGAALPDTPLTTNLGIVSPVLVHQVLFLASNIGYFVAGAAVLRTRESPKTVMGLALMLVGVASLFFHGSQILMPVGSPATKLFCSIDTVLATSQFVVFGSICRQAVLQPSPRFLIGWPLAFFFYACSGGCYTVTHALWHLLTAYLAYGIVEDRDAVRASPSTYRPPMPLKPTLLKRRAQVLALNAGKSLNARFRSWVLKWGKLKKVASISG